MLIIYIMSILYTIFCIQAPIFVTHCVQSDEKTLSNFFSLFLFICLNFYPHFSCLQQRILLSNFFGSLPPLGNGTILISDFNTPVCYFMERIIYLYFLLPSLDNKLKMSKLIVLLMDNQYPFTEDHFSPRENSTILVRQSISSPKQTKNTILAKANFLKNLKNKYLVKVDSLLQQDQAIHIMYEYIENKLSNVLKQASTLLLNKIYAQLSQFGRYLSNIGVRILFNIDRIGITEKQCLKYFMGLQFQWEEDPDEEFLEQFYDKQIEDLLGNYMNQNINLLVPQIQPSISGISNSKIDDPKLRKISYSTLPSRYNRFHKIDEKLKQIKSSSKIGDSENSYPKPASLQHKKYNLKPAQQPLSIKKYEDRKYSGDVKYEVASFNKMYDKESDIQSQYCQRKKKMPDTKCTQQTLQSEAGTNRSKSRADQMKEKQYRQLSSQKKDYLKDFISVLQQDEDHNTPIIPIESCKNRQSQQKSEILIPTPVLVISENSASVLQHLAKQAIEHSLKVMNRFKTLLNDS